MGQCSNLSNQHKAFIKAMSKKTANKQLLVIFEEMKGSGLQSERNLKQEVSHGDTALLQIEQISFYQ